MGQKLEGVSKILIGSLIRRKAYMYSKRSDKLASQGERSTLLILLLKSQIKYDFFPND
jgi:hypothetical protein